MTTLDAVMGNSRISERIRTGPRRREKFSVKRKIENKKNGGLGGLLVMPGRANDHFGDTKRPR